MRKINLNHRLFIYSFSQVFSSSIGSKYGLSIKKNAFFLNTLALWYFLPLTFVQAQHYNQAPEFLKANSRWAFGTGAGLNFNDFSGGGPAPVQTSIGGFEGFASVSDPQTGDLLFYSNGQNCWNADNQVMPNGGGLLGNFGSAAQGCHIVPMIGSVGKYYLFSLPEDWKPGLYYSIVDMSLDNGKGDIDSAKKNILLDKDTFTEGMIAVPGNNCDIWLLVHAYYKSEFKAYHITSNGIDTVPVISNPGGTYQQYLSGNINNYVGAMAISPDRKKVSLSGYYSGWGTPAIYGITLGDFNIATGIISNAINISLDTAGAQYGAYTTCFSPDNSKLYAGVGVAASILGLYQFDISNYDSLAIVTSKTFITNLLGQYGGYLKLYNDTIYINRFNETTIDRINQPNLSGTACNYENNAINLLAGTRCGLGMNSEVVFPGNDTGYYVMDTIVCTGLEEGFELEVSNNNANGNKYKWSTGDTTSSISIFEHGVYWVEYEGICNYDVDSFFIRGSDLYTDITVNGFELGTTGGPFASYQWYFNGVAISGATGPTLAVTQNGDYTVEITDGYGCVFMSEVYKVNNVSIEDLRQLARAIRIYPNPAAEIINIDAPVPVKYVLTGIDGKELLKGDNSLPIPIHSLAQGIYFLTIADREGRILKTEKIIKLP